MNAEDFLPTGAAPNFLPSPSLHGHTARKTLRVCRAVRPILGMDHVDAKNTELGTHVLLVPPLRGSAGRDFRKGGFRFAPRSIVANRQSRTFTEKVSV